MRQEILLATEPRAPFLARRHLTQAIPSRCLAPDRLDDARLAISELVTNALEHAGAQHNDRPKEWIGLVIDAGDDRLRVEVEQPSSASTAHAVGRSGTDPGSGAHGLRVVEAVVDAWGVEPGPPGRVWFEIRL